MNKITSLKERQKQIDKKIQEINAKHKLLENITPSEYKNLRNLYGELCEGVRETKKVKVELEITSIQCLNQNCEIESDAVYEINRYKGKSEDNNRTGKFIEYHTNLTNSHFEVSAKNKKIYKERLAKARKVFKAIAKDKGIDVKVLYDLIPSNKNLKEARAKTRDYILG